MDVRLVARLLVEQTLLGGGGTVLAGLAAVSLLGFGVGLPALVFVLVGGFVAGISVVMTPEGDSSHLVGPAAGVVESIDPRSNIGEPAGSAVVRRFFFGLGLAGFGAAALVLAG